MRSMLLLSLALLAGPAFAAEPQAAAAEPEPAVQAAEPARLTRDVADERVDRHCLRETGTRIRARGDRRACTAFAGRVWTREDLDRTGQIDLASALRMLDVSVR